MEMLDVGTPVGFEPPPVVYEFKGDVLGEIKSKVDFWQVRMESQLSRFNSYADFYRLIRPPRPKNMDGFANPQSSETTRATEAIATFLYRAMTSANPNFQLLSRNPMVQEESLWKAERVLEWQKTSMNHNRKLLRGLRSGSLFGTLAVEAPWVSNQPFYEGTDFIPRSLLQMAFDPMAWDISLSGWHASIDVVTPDYLRNLAKQMPQVYDANAIEEAVKISNSANGQMTDKIRARLNAAGYQVYGGADSRNAQFCYLVTYYGPLEDNPSPNGRDWCVAIVNDVKIVRGHESAYRRRPFLFAYLNEFELEPYGYGVGRVAESSQPDMNSNRGRMHDTSTFSLFNMWIADRSANIKTSQLKARPWGVVEAEGGSKGLEPLRPQLEGINFGLLLEKVMKEEFRATTGATDNLQALVTEATATESSIAQTEAVRRLSVIAENMSESVVRQHTQMMHENNVDFLDKVFWVAATGGDAPQRVFPGELPEDVYVQTKIITDKDFRPQRNKDILQFLQIATSLRNTHPELQNVSVVPWIQELARGVGINPKTAFQNALPMAGPGQMTPGPGPNAPLPNAMDRVGDQLGAMEKVRSLAGELGYAAREQAGTAA